MAAEKTPMWAPEHPAGSELKGGGYRGGPKRWTGKGPRPARHPWPEIFKHHLSVVEGHQKMIDMIRKHTVEGTGNWRIITDMLDRCHEMLAMTKKASRDFVPPPNLRDQVPIGSSSASMYPGYSPADHIYGQAAQEYGAAVSKARAAGVEIRSGSEGAEYEIGQSKGQGKKRRLPPQHDSKSAPKIEPKTAMNAPTRSPVIGETNEYFVIDSFPTQSNGSAPVRASHTTKISVNDDEAGKNVKRAKIAHEDPAPGLTTAIEHEDISQEVDARLKAKEEKRNTKKEKKRKRETLEDAMSQKSSAKAFGENIEAAEDGPEKPRPKKSKKSKGDEKAQGGSSKRRTGGPEEEDGARKKKKKQKNTD